MPSTDKTLETYGNVISGKIRLSKVCRLFKIALTPNDFFFKTILQFIVAIINALQALT